MSRDFTLILLLCNFHNQYNLINRAFGRYQKGEQPWVSKGAPCKVSDAIINSLKATSADRDEIGDSFTLKSFSVALEKERRSHALANGGNDTFLTVLSDEYIRKLWKTTCPAECRAATEQAVRRREALMQGLNSVSFAAIVGRALGVTTDTPFGVVDPARIFCIDDTSEMIGPPEISKKQTIRLQADSIASLQAQFRSPATTRPDKQLDARRSMTSTVLITASGTLVCYVASIKDNSMRDMRMTRLDENIYFCLLPRQSNPTEVTTFIFINAIAPRMKEYLQRYDALNTLVDSVETIVNGNISNHEGEDAEMEGEGDGGDEEEEKEEVDYEEEGLKEKGIHGDKRREEEEMGERFLDMRFDDADDEKDEEEFIPLQGTIGIDDNDDDDDDGYDDDNENDAESDHITLLESNFLETIGRSSLLIMDGATSQMKTMESPEFQSFLNDISLSVVKTAAACSLTQSPCDLHVGFPIMKSSAARMQKRLSKNKLELVGIDAYFCKRLDSFLDASGIPPALKRSISSRMRAAPEVNGYAYHKSNVSSGFAGIYPFNVAKLLSSSPATAKVMHCLSKEKVEELFNLIQILSVESELSVDGGITDEEMERVLSTLLNDEDMAMLTSGQKEKKSLSDFVCNRRRALYLSPTVISSIKADKIKKVAELTQQREEKKSLLEMKKEEKETNLQAAKATKLAKREAKVQTQNNKKVKRKIDDNGDVPPAEELDLDDPVQKAARRSNAVASRASRAASRST